MRVEVSEKLWTKMENKTLKMWPSVDVLSPWLMLVMFE